MEVFDRIAMQTLRRLVQANKATDEQRARYNQLMRQYRAEQKRLRGN